MKIEIDGGAIVCSLEDKNKAFLSACAGLFDGFLDGKLKLEWQPEDEKAPAAAISVNVYRLETLLENAQKYGICVGQTVFDKLAVMRKRLNIICLPTAAQSNCNEQLKWQRLCKNGCGSCKNLRRWNDDHFCAASGDLLEEKNCPAIVNGIYHVVNFAAFPSESCPFNIDKTKGVI